MITLLAAHAFAAEVGLHAGVETVVVREDLIVPLGFGGAGLALGGDVGGALGPTWLSSHLDLGGTVLATQYGQIAVSMDHAIDLRWELRVAGRFTLGPAAGWDGRTNYLESWDDAHAYWVGTQWLGPAMSLGTDLGDDDDLVVRGVVSVLGATGRPPVDRFEKQDPLKNLGYWFTAPFHGVEGTTLARTQVVKLDATITLGEPSGGRWQIGLDTEVLHTSEPADAYDLGATVWVGRLWGA